MPIKQLRFVASIVVVVKPIPANIKMTYHKPLVAVQSADLWRQEKGEAGGGGTRKCFCGGGAAELT